ncbi:MAG: ArsA family ATPase [Myxococcales bacterium]|nr:ArsA family ATPase [Myxococcales bacterium]
MSSLARMVTEARCLVVAGPGGVGKTSVSAALAIEGARLGRRTVVLTIDPARRLANALGISEVGSQETRIQPEAFEVMGMVPPAAPLTAMMLDIKEAWDDVIQRYHPRLADRDRLMNNRLYHALSTALAGSQEYMAMEKLYQLAHRKVDPLDLIVLDTPPARHALDFLDAPHRLMDVLSNDATRWLLEPASPGRLFGSSGLFFRTIARFTGSELLEDLAELLRAFSTMFDGFTVRARAVSDLLGDTSTHFCVIGRPSKGGVRDAQTFTRHLLDKQARVSAVILNRATPRPMELLPSSPDALRAWAEIEGMPYEAVEDLLGATSALADQFREESIQVRQMKAHFSDVLLSTYIVPELSEDVHDLRGLEYLRSALFESGEGKIVSQ